MLKKILVAVDGSPHSVRAVRIASDLASKYDAEVILLHVLLRGHMPAGLKKAMEVEIGGKSQPAANLVNMPQEIMARVKSKADTQLSIEALDYIAKHVLAKVSTICAEHGVKKVSKRVEEGNPAQIILSIAEQADVDMIVMGSRGLSDLRGILVGSVSQKVSSLATCTCVTVR